MAVKLIRTDKKVSQGMKVSLSVDVDWISLKTECKLCSEFIVISRVLYLTLDIDYYRRTKKNPSSNSCL